MLSKAINSLRYDVNRLDGQKYQCEKHANGKVLPCNSQSDPEAEEKIQRYKSSGLWYRTFRVKVLSACKVEDAVLNLPLDRCGTRREHEIVLEASCGVDVIGKLSNCQTEQTVFHGHVVSGVGCIKPWLWSANLAANDKLAATLKMSNFRCQKFGKTQMLSGGVVFTDQVD